MGQTGWMILIVALSSLILVIGSAWAILKWIWSDVPPDRRFVNRPDTGPDGRSLTKSEGEEHRPRQIAKQ